MKILSNDFNYKTNTLNPAFKHKIILDVIDNDPRGQVKISAKTDDGEDIFAKQRVFLDYNSSGFDSSEDFVNKLSVVIKDAYDKVQSICKTKYFEIGEEKLTGINIFVPGKVIGDRVDCMPNITDKEGSCLKNIDFTKYKEFLTDKFLFETGIDVDTNNFKFMVKNNGGGSESKIVSNSTEYESNDSEYLVGAIPERGFNRVDNNRYNYV